MSSWYMIYNDRTKILWHDPLIYLPWCHYHDPLIYYHDVTINLFMDRCTFNTVFDSLVMLPCLLPCLSVMFPWCCYCNVMNRKDLQVNLAIWEMFISCIKIYVPHGKWSCLVSHININSNNHCILVYDWVYCSGLLKAQL